MKTRENSCAGKVRHKDRGSAILALKKVNNAGLSGYHCKFCGGWHLGTQRKKIQNRLDQLLGPIEVPAHYETPKPKRGSGGKLRP